MFIRLKYILLLFLFHQRDKTTVYGIGKHDIGCYLDQQPRTLPHGPLVDDAMTNDMCVLHCCSFLDDATFMGTEAGRECFCSNVSITDNFEKQDTHQCDMECKGNSNEMCGGKWRLSVYRIDCPPKTKTNCLQINHAVWTEEELAEKMYLLRNVISIDKKQTNLYKATKMSVYDPRKSSRNIGIVGVIVLVVPVIIIVIMDVHRICQ